MMMQQVKLKAITIENLNAEIVCWLPIAGLKLKVGMVLELKNDPGLWKIEEVYVTLMELHEINRKWDVGGL
jgi:hypothetical protein